MTVFYFKLFHFVIKTKYKDQCAGLYYDGREMRTAIYNDALTQLNLQPLYLTSASQPEISSRARGTLDRRL